MVIDLWSASEVRYGVSLKHALVVAVPDFELVSGCGPIGRPDGGRGHCHVPPCIPLLFKSLVASASHWGLFDRQRPSFRSEVLGIGSAFPFPRRN